VPSVPYHQRPQAPGASFNESQVPQSLAIRGRRRGAEDRAEWWRLLWEAWGPEGAVEPQMERKPIGQLQNRHGSVIWPRLRSLIFFKGALLPNSNKIFQRELFIR